MTAPTRPHYVFKTKPLGKQLQVIEDHWHEKQHALLCRPGTGKSKLNIDHAGMQYMAGMIDALVVLAPNGVHEQWVAEAIPTHLSEQVPWMGGAYRTEAGKREMEKLEKALVSRDMGLKVLTMSFEAAQTPRGNKLLHRVLDAYRCFVVDDESHRTSNMKTGAFKMAKKAMRKGVSRRIATGTLVRQNPFAAYGQFELLGDSLLGFASLASFKSMYAEMLPESHGLVKKIAKDFKERTGRSITPQIQAKDPDTDRPIYRNLPHLRARLAPWSSFLTLEDVNGTEPTVLPSTRMVEMTPEQRTLYFDLQDVGVTDAPGGQLTADGTLALATRLAQVVGGFCPSDDDPMAAPVPGGNPKLEELLTIIEELDNEKVIIWCKYKPELRAVAMALAERYGEDSVVEYHGDIDSKGRQASKRAFIDNPGTRYFVAQQKAGGTGLDGLQAVSRYMVYYSNDYSYLDREQAVARQARTGGSLTVNVIDIMMRDSVDQDIVNCMQSAQDVHEQVLYRRMTRKWV